jgi:hypothetical protein
MDDEKPLDATSNLSVSLADIVLTTTTGFPIATLLTQGVGIYNAYKASHFSRKLMAFLKEPQKLDDKTRREFEERLGSEKEKFMNEVFQVIDQLENEEKSEILGKVFVQLVAGNIDRESFLLLSDMTTKMSLQDLKYFLDRYGPNKIKMLPSNTIHKRLVFSGIMDEKQNLDFQKAKARHEIIGDNQYPQIEYSYLPTDAGNLLLKSIHYTTAEFNNFPFYSSSLKDKTT